MPHQYTAKELREITVRARARKFASMVRESNMAYFIPEDLVDWLEDVEMGPFKQHLLAFGLRMREDHRWEKA